MKNVITLLCLSLALSGYSQAEKADPASNGRKVSFITTIDKSFATKDGIYINGYVVNLSSDEIERFNGKKVKISGRVTLVKGVSKNAADSMPGQGRADDTMHLIKPRVRVLKQ